MSYSSSLAIDTNRNKLNKSKKCWICLTVLDLNNDETFKLHKIFFTNNQSPNNNYVQLRILFDRFVLSICKCRPRLAHKQCFNNYIDSKQNGNVNILVTCIQCNLKYEFIYPYNGVVLKLFDLIDQFLDVSSTSVTLCGLFLSTYWCSLSFGAITILQTYGIKHGLNILKNSNLFITATFLPLLPFALIGGRFFNWDSILQNFMLHFFKYKSVTNDQKYNDEDEDYNDNDNDDDDDDDEEKEDLKFLNRIRLVVGGLLLPSTIWAIDKLSFGLIFPKNSILFRTFMIGIGFVGLKGFSKILYNKKKLWQKENRLIKNYSNI